MAGITEPRNGIKWGWDDGDFYKTDNDGNLKKIGHVGLHLSVKDRGEVGGPAPA